MYNFYAKYGSISEIVMGAGAVAAAIFAWRAWVISKSSLRHQILNDLFKEYRSPSMGVSIRRLYDFYRKNRCNTDAMIASYIEEFKKDRYSPDSIHYQRRIISGYYQQIAALIEKDRLQKRLVYSVWNRGDLEIIPKILIPIETRALPRALGDSPVLREKDYPKPFRNMLELYRGAST